MQKEGVEAARVAVAARAETATAAEVVEAAMAMVELEARVVATVMAMLTVTVVDSHGDGIQGGGAEVVW